MRYFDSGYLVRLYFDKPGFEVVRALKNPEPWACSLHGKAQTMAAFHRKFREGQISTEELHETMEQFGEDCLTGEFGWLPITETMVDSLTPLYRHLPPDCFLRAADALHLACARDHGFKTMYSNDKHLLAAAKHFGLCGLNVIGKDK